MSIEKLSLGLESVYECHYPFLDNWSSDYIQMENSRFRTFVDEESLKIVSVKCSLYAALVGSIPVVISAELGPSCNALQARHTYCF